MRGYPWTPRKMRDAARVLRDGAQVSFEFGLDDIEKLAVLDATVLSARPDLVLVVSTWEPDGPRRPMRDDELDALVALPNVRRLMLRGFVDRPSERLGDLRRLEWLTVGGRISDLRFLAKLSRLKKLELSLAVPDLAPLAACRSLRKLLLYGQTLRSFAPIAPLSRLETLGLYSGTLRANLAELAVLPKLVELSVSSNRDVTDVDGLAALTGLARLRISQPRVVRLPDLSRSRRLVDVELIGMKAWSNPEILATLPAVRRLELREIGPAARAERFFPLAGIRSLRELDIRFLDYGKRRTASIVAHVEAQGRGTILVRAT